MAVVLLKGSFWWIGLFLLVLGLPGLVVAYYSRPSFLIIDDQKVRSGQGEVEIKCISRVSRREFNEMIYYEIEVSGRPPLIVKAPYLPNQEKQAWASLEMIGGDSLEKWKS